MNIGPVDFASFGLCSRVNNGRIKGLDRIGDERGQKD
jgi:hypothetical protein